MRRRQQTDRHYEMKTPKKKGKPAVQLKVVTDHPFLLSGHRLNWYKIESSHIVCKTGQATIVRDEPGKPISHIELAWRIADQNREAGKPIDDLTRRWIEVPEWTDERENQEIRNFLRPSGDPMGARRLAIRVRINGSQSAARALGNMARECLDQLQVAADTIREDKLSSACASIAAEELAGVIGNACCKMNELALKHPQIFTRFSRTGYYLWPVMKSTYPEFGDDEKALLTKLQLGKDLPLRQDPKAKWARWVKDDAGKIAWHLLWYVWHARSENNAWGADFGEFTIMADALARPNKKSAPKWWEVAKAALLYSYPNLEEVDEFKRLVTAPTKRRSPGRIRQAILDILKARFISLVRVVHRVKKTIHFCDCGNAAVRHSGNRWICENCDRLEHTSYQT